ncbi:unnamed protein product [Arabidopsis halleri]
MANATEEEEEKANATQEEEDNVKAHVYTLQAWIHLRSMMMLV